MRTSFNATVVKLVFYLLLAMIESSAQSAETDPVLIPKVSGPWWRIAGNPDLGKYNDSREKVLDFGIWPAKDGAWQLWACIYHAKCGGKLRLLYGWEGERLSDENWTPKGIKMMAQPELGETPGAVLAPHVYIEDGRYYLSYGNWTHICLAVSDDGKNFTKQVQPNGKTGIFGEGPDAVSRDSHIARFGGKYYCYYCADPDNKGAIYCRTSVDMKSWGPSKIVNSGGRLGSGRCMAQCPFVLWLEKSQRYYLFRSSNDERTGVYVSKDPLDFGVADDSHLVCVFEHKAPEIILHDGKYYMAALMKNRNGIRMARITWEKP